MKAKKQNPVKTRKVELDYQHKLTRVAQHVGDLILEFIAGEDIGDIDVLAINNIMRNYMDSLTPWAVRTAIDMVTRTGIQDARAWETYSQEISAALKREIRNTDTGVVMREMVNRQVELIKSIPKEAAERVNELCIKGLENGSRSGEIMEELLRTTEATKNRAKLIARTETARTASVFTETRALAIGCESYQWVTSHDSDVRKAHKEVDGKVFRFDTDPVLSDGTSCKPGQIWNCRCWLRPIIVD